MVRLSTAFIGLSIRRAHNSPLPGYLAPVMQPPPGRLAP
jgi:hypothetical protein